MRFHEAAALELAEAAAWYESKAEGVGARFLDDIERTIAKLEEMPKLGAQWSHDCLSSQVEVRRFPLRLFPFILIYSLDPATILAIAHGSRKPG